MCTELVLANHKRAVVSTLHANYFMNTALWVEISIFSLSPSPILSPASCGEHDHPFGNCFSCLGGILLTPICLDYMSIEWTEHFSLHRICFLATPTAATFFLFPYCSLKSPFYSIREEIHNSSCPVYMHWTAGVEEERILINTTCLFG